MQRRRGDKVRMEDLQAVSEQFAPIRISTAVADYLRAASRRVCELFGTSLELYFYLLTNSTGKGPARVTHAYLPWGQHLTASSCSLSLEGKLRSYDELGKSGYALAGWAHSHGRMPAFHSGTDDANTLSRTYDSGLEAVCESPVDEEEMPVHLVEVPDDGISMVRLTRVHYAYSVVLSLREQELYGAVGVRDRHGKAQLIKSVPVEIVEAEPGEGALPNDFESIDDELTAKVERL